MEALSHSMMLRVSLKDRWGKTRAGSTTAFGTTVETEGETLIDSPLNHLKKHIAMKNNNRINFENKFESSQKKSNKILDFGTARRAHVSMRLFADYFLVISLIIKVLLEVIGVFPGMSPIVSCIVDLGNIISLIIHLFGRH